MKPSQYAPATSISFEGPENDGDDYYEVYVGQTHTGSFYPDIPLLMLTKRAWALSDAVLDAAWSKFRISPQNVAIEMT